MNLFWESVKLLLALGLILMAIVYVIKYGLVRLQPDYVGRKGTLKIVDRLPLSQRSGLYLVRAAKSYFLLGVSGDSINMLAKLDREEIFEFLNSQQNDEFKDILDSCLAPGEKGSYVRRIQSFVNEKLRGGKSHEE